MIDLGVRPHTDAILAALGPVAGLDILDVGCGEGQTSREMAAQGAHVSGFDPFIGGTEWTPHGPGRYRIVRASAEALPVEDGTADLVIFVFSLHHVPGTKLGAALTEAARALKPAGRLMVAEPLAAGAGYYVSQPYHDEGPVRAAAQAALDAFAAPRFSARERFAYTERRRWDDYETFAQRQIRNMRFNGYTEEAVRSPEVRRRFAEMTAEHGGAFDQPVRIDLFSGPRA
jgi:ubiquinone/menaquinone biosynthesis C-methylase UbiE